MLACRIVSQGPSTEKPPEMDDALDAVDDLLDLVELGEVGRDERLVWREIGRRLDVAQPQVGIDGLQQLAQARADVAGGAGQQHAFHLAGLLLDVAPSL